MDEPALIKEYTVLPQVIPEPIRRAYSILPVKVEAESVLVVTPQGIPASALSNLSFQLGITIKLEIIDKALFDILAQKSGEDTLSHGASEVNPSKSDEIDPLRPTFTTDRMFEGPRSPTSYGSLISLVNSMIQGAINKRASDIHIEPYENTLRVRFRIDGVLQEVPPPNHDLARSLISRLKIMADLDIAEKRRPQDGRIRFGENGRSIDIRVSTLPTDFGEKIVLRILDKQQLELNLTKLGFEDHDLKVVQKTLHLPYGMILVTGPTGSGKTTTLYAALEHINDPSINITTIEEPIEYNLPGINQTHVKKDIGLTFAASLRSILRQDPNVIMVGEIRDNETAEIAVRAALTGHVVLSTLHTNDAPSAITRLVDMGIEPFLVAASVRMIIAQRLVRKLCLECRGATHPTCDEHSELNIDPSATIYRPKGCPECAGLGYRGRTAIYELLKIDNGIADKISRGVTTSELRSLAGRSGMKSLREVALAKAKNGVTSLEEVLRETTLT